VSSNERGRVTLSIFWKRVMGGLYVSVVGWDLMGWRDLWRRLRSFGIGAVARKSSVSYGEVGLEN
jgi:hypothetical protein